MDLGQESPDLEPGQSGGSTADLLEEQAPDVLHLHGWRTDTAKLGKPCMHTFACAALYLRSCPFIKSHRSANAVTFVCKQALARRMPALTM